MSKPQRKMQEQYNFEREEKSHHYYKIQKTEQSKKMLRSLDKALKTKDLHKLIHADEY